MDKIKKGPGRPRKIPKIEEPKTNYKIRWSYPSSNRISVKCMWEGKGSLNTDFLDCETSPIFFAGVNDELKWQIKVSRLNEFLEDYPFMVVVQFLNNIKHNCKIGIRTRGSVQTVLKAFDDADNNLECDGVGFNPNEFWDYSLSSQNYIFDIEILADSSKGIKTPQMTNCKNLTLPETKTDPKLEIKEQSEEMPKPDSKVDVPELDSVDILKLTNSEIKEMPNLDKEQQSPEVKILNLDRGVSTFTNDMPCFNMKQIFSSVKENQNPMIENPKCKEFEILRFSMSKITRESSLIKAKQNTEDKISELEEVEILRFPSTEIKKQSSLTKEKQDREVEILEEVKIIKFPKSKTKKESCLNEKKQDLEMEIAKLEKLNILRLKNVKMYVSQNDSYTIELKKISSSLEEPKLEILQDEDQKQIIYDGKRILASRPSSKENSQDDPADFPIEILQDKDKDQTVSLDTQDIPDFKNYANKDIKTEIIHDNDREQTVIVETEEVPGFENYTNDVKMEILQDNDQEQTVIDETKKVLDFKNDVEDIEMKISVDNNINKLIKVENRDTTGILPSEQGFKMVETEVPNRDDRDFKDSQVGAEKKDQEKKLDSEDFETKTSNDFDKIPKILMVEKNAEHLKKEIWEVNNQKNDTKFESLDPNSVSVEMEVLPYFGERVEAKDQKPNNTENFEMLEINSMQLNILPELQDFASMTSDMSYVDAFIIIEGKKIAAHKCILACRSSFFKNNFSLTKSEIRIENGVTYETMKSVLIFIYTGCIMEKEPRNLVQMFDAAKSLDIPALRTKLEEVFDKMINKKNAMELFLLADEIRSEILKNCVAKFMI